VVLRCPTATGRALDAERLSAETAEGTLRMHRTRASGTAQRRGMGNRQPGLMHLLHSRVRSFPDASAGQKLQTEAAPSTTSRAVFFDVWGVRLRISLLIAPDARLLRASTMGEWSSSRLCCSAVSHQAGQLQRLMRWREQTMVVLACDVCTCVHSHEDAHPVWCCSLALTTGGHDRVNERRCMRIESLKE